MEHITPVPYQRLSLVLIALFLSLAAGRASEAQVRIVANLPDAPMPKQPPSDDQQKSNNTHSTYDILSRRSFFFPDLAFTTKPLSSGQKFLLAVDESAAPSALIPGYGQGWNAYGKRYGATLALNASTDMFGTFLLPSVLHHDPRYFILAHGTFSQKIGHALKSVLVTHTDSGERAPNISGILGPLGAEGLANTYLPDAERTAGQTFERFGIQMAVIAGANVAKEFWPAIFKTLRIGKVVPGASPDARSDSSRQ